MSPVPQAQSANRTNRQTDNDFIVNNIQIDDPPPLRGPGSTAGKGNVNSNDLPASPVKTTTTGDDAVDNIAYTGKEAQSSETTLEDTPGNRAREARANAAEERIKENRADTGNQANEDPSNEDVEQKNKPKDRNGSPDDTITPDDRQKDDGIKRDSNGIPISDAQTGRYGHNAKLDDLDMVEEPTSDERKAEKERKKSEKRLEKEKRKQEREEIRKKRKEKNKVDEPVFTDPFASNGEISQKNRDDDGQVSPRGGNDQANRRDSSEPSLLRDSEQLREGQVDSPVSDLDTTQQTSRKPRKASDDTLRDDGTFEDIPISPRDTGRKERKDSEKGRTFSDATTLVDDDRESSSTEASGVLSGAALGGPMTILRKAFFVIRHAPFFSLLTAGLLVLWIEGSRQLGNMVILSTSTSIPQKRAFDPDLEVTTGVAEDMLKTTSFSSAGLFVMLNLFQLICITLISISFSTAISRAKRPREANPDIWWKNPFNTIRSAASSMVEGFAVLFMGAQLHGPMTLLSQATLRTYIRLCLFLLQLVLTLLLFRQAMSFTYIVLTGSSTSFSESGDLTTTAKSLSEAASGVNSITAFLGLSTLLGFIILTLAFGWFSLLNPKPSSGKGFSLWRKTYSPKTILMLKLVGAIVVTSVFIGLMYFFAEITNYTATSNTSTSTYDINLIGAMFIMMVFMPAMGWCLLVFWDTVKVMKNGIGCCGSEENLGVERGINDATNGKIRSGSLV